jgi:MarR-like DNA-binding transcriptional regulator SgrR of sgrS sRNA
MTPAALDAVTEKLRALYEAQRAPVPTPRLAEVVYASERTVQRYLRQLEAGGLVECVSRPGRAQRGRAVVGWQPSAPRVALRGRDGGTYLQYVLQGFEHLSQLTARNLLQ